MNLFDRLEGFSLFDEQHSNRRQYEDVYLVRDGHSRHHAASVTHERVSCVCFVVCHNTDVEIYTGLAASNDTVVTLKNKGWNGRGGRGYDPPPLDPQGYGGYGYYPGSNQGYYNGGDTYIDGN